MATNGPSSHAEQYASSVVAAAPAAADPTNVDLGKDEIAWYFVEQYYTTLSKNPEKLHLFYGKKSQFVYGQEGQTATISQGRQTIQERIKDLDFQNCKVRVSNVDSQASYENIVIQVIGETSNKAGEPKKFVQTFVLAQQPSGYFILNDILRFIDEEGDDEPTSTVQMPSSNEPENDDIQAAQEPAQEAEAVLEPSVEEQAATIDPGAIDKKLEEVTLEEPASVNGDAASVQTAEEPEAVPEAASKADEELAAPDPEVTARELAEEAAKEAEKPADPSPTPIATRKPPAAAPAPAPAQPPKPMSWASRAAAAVQPKVSPAVPLKAAPAATPARAAAPTATPAASQPPAPTTQNTEAPATAAKEASAEWQTAGGDSKRQNRPQSISGPPVDKDGTLGYVKYVTDKVGREDLEAALTQHGELAYFDINRQKNCAFVEFKTAAGYQAAVGANPHVINGESIVVEPRRPKAGAYGGSNYSAGRGGAQNRGGRGGFEGGRTGSGNQGGRGNFGGQNRGRGGMPRGRGASQAANA